VKIKAKLTRIVLQELDIIIDAQVDSVDEFGIKTDSDLDKRLFNIDSEFDWKDVEVMDIGDVAFYEPKKTEKADIVLSKEESDENKLPPVKMFNYFNFIEPITSKGKLN
jgi:hypothetical protein